jgi:hypothetical protein
MADLAPSSAVTKMGSIAVIVAIALVVIYLANNNKTVGSWVAKKAPAA